jgi:hypothetical protein
MSKFTDLIREHRQRLRRPEDELIYVRWQDFGGSPHKALGLLQDADESYEDFKERLAVEATARGIRIVWIKRVFVAPAPIAESLLPSA